MPSLRETQTRLMAVLTGMPGAAAWADAAALVLDDGLGGRQRLQVYRNNTVEALSAALIAVHPVLARLVGEDCMAAVAQSYIARHPSRSANVLDYGEGLADHLANLPELAGLPYLADMARLEWAMHGVFHATEAPALEITRLAVLSPRQQLALRVARHPAARVIRSHWPLLRIWQAHQLAADDELPSMHLDGTPETMREEVLVIRRGLDVSAEALAPPEAALLRALDCPQPLEAACAEVLETLPSADLAAALASVLVRGALVLANLPTIEGVEA